MPPPARAAAVAGAAPAPPSEVGILARLTIINNVAAQAFWMFEKKPPSGSPDELKHTCFETDTTTKVVKVAYAVRACGPSATCGGALRKQFGNIVDVEFPDPFPFQAARETLEAAARTSNGREPVAMVEAGRVRPANTIVDAQEFEDVLGGEAGHNHLLLCSIVTATLPQVTRFKVTGSPNLGQSTVYKVATNNGSYQEAPGGWSTEDNEPTGNGALRVDRSLRALRIGPTDENYACSREALICLMRHVLADGYRQHCQQHHVDL